MPFAVGRALRSDTLRPDCLQQQPRLQLAAVASWEMAMSLGTILLIVLVLLLVGALPTWGYSSSWGYGPGGIVGLLLIIVIVLVLTGRI